MGTCRKASGYVKTYAGRVIVYGRRTVGQITRRADGRPSLLFTDYDPVANAILAIMLSAKYLYGASRSVRGQCETPDIPRCCAVCLQQQLQQQQQ
jgi:hypothetical protein